MALLLLVLSLIRYIEKHCSLRIISSFQLASIMRTLVPITNSFLLLKKVYATNQKYYHYLIDNPDSITKSWNEQKFENMISFYKELYYSDDVRSKLDSSELAIAKIFFVNGMTHILASLFKSNLYKLILN